MNRAVQLFKPAVQLYCPPEQAVSPQARETRASEQGCLPANVLPGGPCRPRRCPGQRAEPGGRQIDGLGIPSGFVHMIIATDQDLGTTAMPYQYDDTNIFARILRGEIPNRTVLETDHTLAFHDIRPHAPAHVLIIPKGRYVTFDHFAAEGSAQELVDFHRTAAQVCALLGVTPGAGGAGYRTISNSGPDSNQEVPHYHLHILGGRNLGPLLA